MEHTYEMVIGLEVHAELKTKSKIFCGCSTDFGAQPNTQCCPVCMGMPGTLPVLNGKAVEYAVKAGLALHCDISPVSRMDRKNYFYPDLPKAYQITQYDLPLCQKGWLDITTPEGNKRIGITRIHLEEDAGKLIHTPEGGTLCDYNRCGVPLIEIVSEPDLRCAREAGEYLRKLRSVLRYTDICDGKMQEGSFRCDVNLSVRRKGEKKLGTRTEMKNLNSFQFVEKAIEYEFRRQINILEAGKQILQETRRFDEKTGQTYAMRSKENANDYRYFPEPDLPPVVLPEGMISRLEREIPALPDERKERYNREYGINTVESEMLVAEKEIADYFEEGAAQTKSPAQLAHLLTSEVFRLMPPGKVEIPISCAHLAQVADLLWERKINSGTGKKLIAQMWKKDQNPVELVEQQNLWQIGDEAQLLKVVEEVIHREEKSVEDYHNGKRQAMETLVGQAMRLTKGKGDPIIIRTLVEKLLS